MKNVRKISAPMTMTGSLSENSAVLFAKFMHNFEKYKEKEYFNLRSNKKEYFNLRSYKKKVFQPEIEVSSQVHAAGPHLCSTQPAPGKERFSLSF